MWTLDFYDVTHNGNRIGLYRYESQAWEKAFGAARSWTGFWRITDKAKASLRTEGFEVQKRTFMEIDQTEYASLKQRADVAEQLAEVLSRCVEALADRIGEDHELVKTADFILTKVPK